MVVIFNAIDNGHFATFLDVFGLIALFRSSTIVASNAHDTWFYQNHYRVLKRKYTKLSKINRYEKTIYDTKRQ